MPSNPLEIAGYFFAPSLRFKPRPLGSLNPGRNLAFGVCCTTDSAGFLRLYNRLSTGFSLVRVSLAQILENLEDFA